MTIRSLTMKKPAALAMFFTGIVGISLLFSCKKDDKPDTSLPAFHISESEKLVIPPAIDLPANLPAGNTRIASFFADGVQKYGSQQKAGSDPEEFEWVFIAPQADLYDASNNKVGTHSAGPTWQLTGGADSIYGQAFSPPRTASAFDPSSIDWLLLMPKAGKIATGVFANVAYIQRIDTKGGKAPVAPPVRAGQTIDVPYTAIYRFTRQN